MSDIIHLLPDNIANQIAAGEVIQRPASVVKELVENSLDANATRIQVNIKDAGKTLIQVIDDGRGMSPTDARMAFERHATSKISKAEDLFALTTMGFRGEALASIAAVAHVELRTRKQDAELGARLLFQGSELQESEMDICDEGSNFSIKHLFFNVPARRKFLKSNETEFRNIINEFERVALVNPHVSFSLYHNDVEIYNLPESNLKQRILNIFGKSLGNKLISVETESSMVTISGFVGTPDSVKKRGALQFFFVNGRFMKHPYFHKAVMQAYEQLVPVGEVPNYFLYFTLDPSSIDVNIHPTKTEVKFENEQPIWQILNAAIREALAKSSSIPSIDFDSKENLDIPVYNPSSNYINEIKIQTTPNYNPFTNSSESSASNNRPGFDWQQLYNNFESERVEIDQELTDIEGLISSEDDEILPNVLFEDVKEVQSVCYQHKRRYIVTSLKSGLVVIDQHRAHVRILYDQYLSTIKQRKGVSQQLLFPYIVEFTVAENEFLPTILDDMSYVGFDLTNLGNNSYAINGLPVGVDKLDPMLLVKEIVNKSIESVNIIKDDMAHILALSLANAAAIPYGKEMSFEEMDYIVASLFSSPMSNFTPDGKTVLTVLDDSELDKRFK